MPAVTFTDPALARVGLTEAEARRAARDIRILRFPSSRTTAPRPSGMPAGMIKVVTTPDGRILGAAIVGHDAGELIALWSLAIAERLTSRRMRGFVPPYPSRSAIVAARRPRAFLDGPRFDAALARRIIEFLRKFG